MKDKPIVTGLSSFGMSGQVFHAPLIKANNHFKLSRILERAKNISREKYPDCEIVRSFEELINDPSIELIVVNTPDKTHFELCKKALMAGKHVIVEKPFTLRYTEAMELDQLAEGKALLLSVFHNRRWDSDFLTVQKIIREGLLGRLVEFESHFDRFRTSVRSDSWKENPDSKTGTTYNLGTHLIDQALVLFGKPKAVYADIRTLREEAVNDDYFEIILKYDHIRVCLKASYLTSNPGPKFILHGTKGSFLKWGEDPQEQALKNIKPLNSKDWGIEKEEYQGILTTLKKDELVKEKIISQTGNYMEYYDLIYNAIRLQEVPPVSAKEGAEVIRIVEAAYQSNLEKRDIIV
jgi:scyllo-inositol 2-dehydrogenase (NADP+)